MSVVPGKIRLTSIAPGKVHPQHSAYVPSTPSPLKRGTPHAGVYDFSVEKKKPVKNELSQPLGVNVHSSCFPRKAS